MSSKVLNPPTPLLPLLAIEQLYHPPWEEGDLYSVLNSLRVLFLLTYLKSILAY